MSSGNKAAVWRDGLERAILYDSWGQMVEAADEYTDISKVLQCGECVHNLSYNV